MKAETRRFIRFSVVWGIVVCLVTNLITMPGYRTGSEGTIIVIERHFGWPAEYYADLWNNESPNEPNLLAFMPLLPLSIGMRFHHFDFSFLALLLNVVVVACAVILLVLFARTMDQGRVEGWVATTAGIVLVAGLVAFSLADDVGAFL